MQPPAGNDAGQQRCRECIEKPADRNEPMKANEHGGLDNDGQRNRNPDANSEKNASAESRREHRDVETDDEREKTGDSECVEDVEQTRNRVTLSAFRPPGLRSFLLILMKDAAHQQPARENRDNAGDEAGNQCSAERIHGGEIERRS